MTTAEIIAELGPQGIGQESIANALEALGGWVSSFRVP
jgi:hypothetical protein